jgi:hypothetical protein
VLVTALCLAAWRALTFVPLPGIDLHGTTPTAGVSPVALGLGPYIDAFVVIVLLRFMSSTFNSMIREGSIARYRVWELLITLAVTAPVPTERHVEMLRWHGRGPWVDRMVEMGMEPRRHRLTRRQAALQRRLQPEEVCHPFQVAELRVEPAGLQLLPPSPGSVDQLARLGLGRNDG